MSDLRLVPYYADMVCECGTETPLLCYVGVDP